jgi:hypothetical protein
MPTDTPRSDASPPKPSRDDNKFKIDFIDPLFAVAIHIGFVEGLLHENWLHTRGYPNSLSDIANLLLFIAAFWVIVASWVGYHKSIYVKPIIEEARFILDVVLLTLYIFLLLYFREPIGLVALMVAIYFLYVAWDFCKTKEYSNSYYETGTPGGLRYLGMCFAGWLQPGRYTLLRSEVVTLGWMIFFLILFPFTLLPHMESDWGKIALAAILIVANSIYRCDKLWRGAWICSTPFKLFMAAMIIFLVLYYTRLLCFN